MYRYLVTNDELIYIPRYGTRVLNASGPYKSMTIWQVNHLNKWEERTMRGIFRFAYIAIWKRDEQKKKQTGWNINRA